MPFGLTVAEELVLISVPYNNQCTFTSSFAFLGESRPPCVPPISFNCIQSRFETLLNEEAGQPVICAIVKFKDPELSIGYTKQVSSK